MRNLRALSIPAALCIMGAATTAALGGAHTWDVVEIFSSADGTIQFIEIREMNGTPGETGVAGHMITSTALGRTFTIPANAVAPTTNKSILFATPAYAALSGVPPADYTFPAGSVPFLSLTADTISYTPYDSTSFVAGQLPTTGIHSFLKGGTTAVSSPKNYLGATGVVFLPSAPAVPDGSGGSQSMKATRLDAAGTSLSLTFDVLACKPTGGTVVPTQHYIIYGDKAQLPATVGGAFGVRGSVCNVPTTPYTWNGVPSAIDGSGLVWWLMVTKNSFSKEGSWGESNTGAERVGPGTSGSSGQCGATGKDATNACGH
jgi:hypothetical protein